MTAAEVGTVQGRRDPFGKGLGNGRWTGWGGKVVVVVVVVTIDDLEWKYLSQYWLLVRRLTGRNVSLVFSDLCCRYCNS